MTYKHEIPSQRTCEGAALKGHVKINKELCKECHLCIVACKKGNIRKSDEYNTKGYHPVCFIVENECAGCAFCALTCPEIAIEVYRE
jgi:2-oxoglutarate ferredoxin oxidoreductase subunit delta